MQSQDSRSDALRLAALHGASFAVIGVSMPFLPVWMESRALGPAAIGVLLAIPTVVRVLATAPLMRLADRPGGAFGLLVAGHGVTAVGYGLMLGAGDAVAIGALVALVALAQATIVPTGDLLTTEAVRANPGLNYGRLRVWGSLAFLATSLGGGVGLAVLPPDGILWSLVGLALVALAVAAWAARPLARGGGEAVPPAARLRLDLPRPLVLAILACALIQASHAAVYAFGSIHWRALGFSGPVIGGFWAIGVVAEIGLFVGLGGAVGGGARGLGLVALGGAAAVLRFGALALDPGLAATVLLQAMHALTFAATHLGAMAALTALSPPGRRGAAQGAYAAAVALAVALATVASGLIYRAAGPAAFAAMVPLALAGTALAFAAMRAGRGGRREDP